MRKLSANEQKIVDWYNELCFDSADYTDIQVIEIAKKAMDFAYEHFKEDENAYEGYLYKYEVWICNIGLAIDAYLKKNVKSKKSTKIKQFVLDTINNENYSSGRDGFVLLLYILKMDEELRTIATERKDFWENPRIRFQLLYSLFRRKIAGFTEIAEMLIANNPKETELKKYAKKYIEKFNQSFG